MLQKQSLNKIDATWLSVKKPENPVVNKYPDSTSGNNIMRGLQKWRIIFV